MNKYIINRKIHTIAGLFEDFNFLGFRFSSYYPKDEFNINNSGLLALKKIEAKNFHEASKQFTSELIVATDILSVITQCHFSLSITPLYIKKENNNRENIIFINFVRDKVGVGMRINGDDVKDAEMINKPGLLTALHFFREANSTMSLKSRAAMLFIVGEALAGDETKEKICPKCNELFNKRLVTNKSEMINIFGDDLSKKIYYGKGSLRNKLLHGHKVDDSALVEVCKEMHNKIILYLAKKYKLKNLKIIKSAPRSPNSFEFSRTFIKSKVDHIELRKLNRAMFKKIETGSLHDGDFEIITEPTAIERLYRTY